MIKAKTNIGHPKLAQKSVPLKTIATQPSALNQLNEADHEEGQLALDVYQTATEIVILAPIAGCKFNDITVSITEDVLTIKGKRYLETEVKDEDYLTQECFWGNFSRSIVLPASVDSSKINASLKDAVLKLTLPRTEKEKTRIVRIKTA